ncbi:MAG: FecR family protein, partial [Chitinophagaceae bacterium]|nr:FecR family protein [Chitinophagaceae bacterium]
LIYDGDKSAGIDISYNTMSTPKGGQYQLTLVDGTKVWLNAASSITYPAIFTGNNRKVIVKGEVYFEVAKDKNKPFVVQTDTDEINVLGTSFNVNAYRDRGYIKTSLIDGAIKIGNILLQPGQAFANGKIVKTDIQQDIAWKNGLFNFSGASLEEVMLELSRWYDVDIVYEHKPEKYFDGKMDRGLTLLQALKILKQTGIHFRIEDRKLIVE